MARMRKVRNLSYFAEDLGSCLWCGTTKCSQLKRIGARGGATCLDGWGVKGVREERKHKEK